MWLNRPFYDINYWHEVTLKASLMLSPVGSSGIILTWRLKHFQSLWALIRVRECEIPVSPKRGLFFSWPVCKCRRRLIVVMLYGCISDAHLGCLLDPLLHPWLNTTLQKKGADAENVFLSNAASKYYLIWIPPVNVREWRRSCKRLGSDSSASCDCRCRVIALAC